MPIGESNRSECRFDDLDALKRLRYAISHCKDNGGSVALAERGDVEDLSVRVCDQRAECIIISQFCNYSNRLLENLVSSKCVYGHAVSVRDQSNMYGQPKSASEKPLRRMSHHIIR